MRDVPVISEAMVKAFGSPPVPGTESSPEGLNTAIKSRCSSRMRGRRDCVTGELTLGSLAKGMPSKRNSTKGLVVVLGESAMPSHLTSYMGALPRHHSMLASAVSFLPAARA